MRIIITGASGFIGQPLCLKLNALGHEVVALTRNPEKFRKSLGKHVIVEQWDGKTAQRWQHYLEDCAALINLAGENIAGKRWNAAVKARILSSRLNACEAIGEAMRATGQRPGVILQASATGFYGSKGDLQLDESDPPGEGFLAGITQAWEAAMQKAAASESRLVLLRSGIVLGSGGGALPKLTLPFRFFMGGAPGGGRQWVSWIHLSDVINSICFLLENPSAEGIYNLVAPAPVQMSELCRQIGIVLRRPSWLAVPASVLKLLLQEMAEETILSSQRILPGRLTEAGYPFLFPELLPALKNLLRP